MKVNFKRQNDCKLDKMWKILISSEEATGRARKGARALFPL